MSRREVDDWLARADDVLRTWEGSPDAMDARGAPDDADPELPLLGDNEAQQTWPLPRRRPQRPGLLARLIRRVPLLGRKGG